MIRKTNAAIANEVIKIINNCFWQSKGHKLQHRMQWRTQGADPGSAPPRFFRCTHFLKTRPKREIIVPPLERLKKSYNKRTPCNAKFLICLVTGFIKKKCQWTLHARTIWIFVKYLFYAKCPKQLLSWLAVINLYLYLLLITMITTSYMSCVVWRKPLYHGIKRDQVEELFITWNRSSPWETLV